MNGAQATGLAAAIRRIRDHQQAMRQLAEELAAERDASPPVPEPDPEPTGEQGAT